MLDLTNLLPGSEAGQPDNTPKMQTSIEAALKAAREHLGMEVAYVSEFLEDKSVFRSVDAPGKEHLAKAGDAHALEDVYCKHILEGRLPELIPDTKSEPVAMSLPITKAVPIGAHMSVPIRLSSGKVYGMFCCLSSKADPSLTERDLSVMRAFADIAAQQIEADTERNAAFEEKRSAIEAVIANKAFMPAFQPIWDFSANRIIGFECLTRFTAQPYRPPNEWFDEAESVGLGVELEIAAARAGMEAASILKGEAYITLNFSPATVRSPIFADLFASQPVDDYVLEITEHAPVQDHSELLRALKELRQRGMKFAIDDAGAGHSGLQRIVELSPDIIKLDMSLTRDLDTKPALRALASALIFFSRETGSRIIAEGIESQEELDTLRVLGVNCGQGYLLGRPVSAELATDLLRNDQALESILKLRSA